MKKMILGLVAATTVLSGHAFAADAKADTKMETSIQARLIEQILNSIEKPPAVDFNINDLTIEGGGENEKTKININDANLKGNIYFSRDWTISLVSPSQVDAADEQMKKLLPKLKADASSLFLKVDGKMKNDEGTLDAGFYLWNSGTKKWLPSPLVVNVANGLNKNLLTIQLLSVNAKLTTKTNNSRSYDITGGCDSSKTLFNAETGKSQMTPVKCEFKGTKDENGKYKIKFVYATK